MVFMGLFVQNCPKQQLINRRSFLAASASCLALGLRKPIGAQTASGHAQLTELDIADCRAQLLELINVERGLADLPPVQLDELACRIESEHAQDMAAGHFLSHWGSDDRKPYQRYSLGGGTDFTEENVGAADQDPPFRSHQAAPELIGMNLRMHNEQPPNDGHRRTILGPNHTHVGLGIALSGRSLRLAELFITRCVQVKPLARLAKPKAKLLVEGNLLNRDYKLQQADVFFEPGPEPALFRSKIGRRYGLPDEFVTLRPRLDSLYLYADGTKGTIDTGSNGRFRIPVTLFENRPGIYTIVLWLKKPGQQKGFPATEICIQAV
jgi:uncharacterized protein YkwD